MSVTKTLLSLGMAASAYAGFAPTVWDTSNSDDPSAIITYLATTLQVPDLPADRGLFLWPGMYAENDWLVQTILTNDPQYTEGTCAQPVGQNVWCIQSVQFSGTHGQFTDTQSQPVNPGDLLDIVYSFDPSTGNTTQTTTRESDGAQLTTLNYSSGGGYRLANSIECHQNVASTPEHYYTKTTITLSAANCDFSQHLNADNSSPTSFSSDDCTTWYIDQIVLGADSCTA